MSTPIIRSRIHSHVQLACLGYSVQEHLSLLYQHKLLI
jgi:hypothetical protein